MRQVIALTTWTPQNERRHPKVVADVLDGLAIHRPHDTGPDALEDIWVITHVRSGDRACYVRSEATALLVRERLLERLDWTQEAKEVRRHIDAEQVSAVIAYVEREIATNARRNAE